MSHNWVNWMETRGMAVLSVVAYPFMYLLINIIGLCVYKKWGGIKRFNTMIRDMWNMYVPHP